MKAIKSGAMLAALFASAFMGLASPASAQQPFPNPLLYLTGIEHYSTAGGNFVRYRYDVLNKDQYPDALFAAAPHLPPCGTNTWDRSGSPRLKARSRPAMSISR